MSELYICKHFKIGELVPPDAIAMYGAGIWGKLTEEIKITADLIREYFGKPMTINNRYQKQRGLRTPTSLEYKSGSQHSIGNAIDFNIDGISPVDIRKEITANIDHEAFMRIGGVEDFPFMPWVHVDCRPRVHGRILIFGR